MSNKRKSESHIIVTNDNDEDICDSLEIANKFCTFFSTIIADRLDEAIPTTDTDPMDYLSDALPHQFTPPPYKSKNKKIENNYRPISLLLTISKLFEKLYKTRECQYLNEHNILYNQRWAVARYM